MYWAARTRIPDIADAMPRNKYFKIRANLRIRDYSQVTNEENQNNKYWKVSPFPRAIRDECLLNPRPVESATDEQMVSLWGSTKMRQHIKGKPNLCGLKNCSMCS